SMAWYEDILVGALGSGVNAPTFVLLNVVIGLAVLTLCGLLAHSILRNPVLTPHVIVLLILAFGLWASINWLISNLGLTDAEEQHKQLFGNKEQEEKEGDKTLKESSGSDGNGDTDKKDN
ncbi:hypothetical protein Agub_g2725, partial [Astrephomene gubernaculifera]